MMTREERREYQRAWRAADPERTRAYDKKGYEKNREARSERAKAKRAVDPEGRRAKRRAAYALDPEPLRASKKAWRDANPERHRAADDAWNAANPGRMAELGKAWREANPERHAANVAAWNEANPGRMAELIRAWAIANPNRRRTHSTNRRARVVSAFVESVDLGAVFIRDGGVCQICDTFIGDAEWHGDHRIPLSKGGEHSYANVQLAHAFCNLSKGSKVPA